jgi:hypothetical protein
MPNKNFATLNPNALGPGLALDRRAPITGSTVPKIVQFAALLATLPGVSPWGGYAESHGYACDHAVDRFFSTAREWPSSQHLRQLYRFVKNAYPPMNPLPDPEDIDAASQLINQYATSDWVRISYSTHARQKLSERYVPQGVVELALRSGVVVAFRVVTMQGHVT